MFYSWFYVMTYYAHRLRAKHSESFVYFVFWLFIASSVWLFLVIKSWEYPEIHYNELFPISKEIRIKHYFAQNVLFILIHKWPWGYIRRLKTFLFCFYLLVTCCFYSINTIKSIFIVLYQIFWCLLIGISWFSMYYIDMIPAGCLILDLAAQIEFLPFCQWQHHPALPGAYANGCLSFSFPNSAPSGPGIPSTELTATL